MCMCAHMLEHVCIWRPDNFGCHSSSGLSLAWPAMIPVLGGDWLTWLARGPQGSSCNQPQCCAYTCVRLDVTSVGSWEWNSGPHACVANTLQTELCPRPFSALFTESLGCFTDCFSSSRSRFQRRDGELTLWPEAGAVKTLMSSHHSVGVQ